MEDCFGMSKEILKDVFVDTGTSQVFYFFVHDETFRDELNFEKSKAELGFVSTIFGLLLPLLPLSVLMSVGNRTCDLHLT